MAELATKTDLLAMTQDLQKELRAIMQQLDDSFERQILQLTVRFGIMMAVGVAAVVIIVKLF